MRGELFFPPKGIRNTLFAFRQQTRNIVRHCRRLIFRPEFKWVGTASVRKILIECKCRQRRERNGHYHGQRAMTQMPDK